MVRRSFRIGLRVGLLAGLVAAVAKTVQSRRSSGEPASAPVAEWPPVQSPSASPVPEVPDVQAEVDTLAPVRKATATPKKAGGRTRKAAAPKAAWVEPTGAVCPSSHPVKAKLSSRLYHLPGMLAYARTTPDRCYATPEQAEADGLTKAKR